MLAYDVFTNDAFTAIEVTEAAGNIVYIPQALKNMNLFEPDPISTTEVAIYRRNNQLSLVPTTPRGSQETLPERDTNSMRKIPTIRLAQTDRVNSHELQNIVIDGRPFDVNLDSAIGEIDKRQRKLIQKLELTREMHRLAALQGILLDADGSVIMNYFTEFGFTQPPEILFNFATLIDGGLREYITQQVRRPIATVLRNTGRMGTATRVGALCGDQFYDSLIKNKEVRDTYLGYQAAQDLREGKMWDSFTFAGVEWMNWEGSNETSLQIPTNKCKFFPIGAQDVFKEFRAPGEDMEFINQPGLEFYSMVSPDPRPNRSAYVDLFLYAYPLFACIGPDVLLRGSL
jgi:Phage major capsid protein E